MSKIWFTSDTHFGHDNIIRYCKRGFKNIEEMDKKLIQTINSRVKKGDKVFHLGDFCFKNKAVNYLDKLNGQYIIVCGNHDYNNGTNTPIMGMNIEYGGRLMYLVHNPKDYNPEYPINLVGHVHKLWKSKREKDGTILINVGIDIWGKPISISEILMEVNKYENTRHALNNNIKKDVSNSRI